MWPGAASTYTCQQNLLMSKIKNKAGQTGLICLTRALMNLITMSDLGALFDCRWTVLDWGWNVFSRVPHHVDWSLNSVERGCFSKDFNGEFPPKIPNSTAADHIWIILKITASVSRSPLCTADEWCCVCWSLANYPPVLKAVSYGYWSDHELFIRARIICSWHIFTLSDSTTIWHHLKHL